MAVEATNFSVERVKKARRENDSLEYFDSRTLAKCCQELQIKTSGTKKAIDETIVSTERQRLI